MISKIKAFGMAFVGLIALSAVGASVAQAGSIDVGAQPAVITGQNEIGGIKTIHKLKIKSTNGAIQGNSECKNATLEGTTTGQTGVNEVTLTATYAECEFFGEPATVTMNGCKYTLTGSGQAANTALVDVVGCTTGKSIEIAVPGFCTLTIPEQNGLSHLVGDNVAGSNPADVIATATVSSITVTQDGALCPDGNNHHGTNASFEGETTLRAFQDS